MGCRRRNGLDEFIRTRKGICPVIDIVECTRENAAVLFKGERRRRFILGFGERNGSKPKAESDARRLRIAVPPNVFKHDPFQKAARLPCLFGEGDRERRKIASAVDKIGIERHIEGNFAVFAALDPECRQILPGIDCSDIVERSADRIAKPCQNVRERLIDAERTHQDIAERAELCLVRIGEPLGHKEGIQRREERINRLLRKIQSRQELRKFALHKRDPA